MSSFSAAFRLFLPVFNLYKQHVLRSVRIADFKHTKLFGSSTSVSLLADRTNYWIGY